MRMWVFEKETGVVLSGRTPSVKRAASEDEHLAAGGSRCGRADRPLPLGCSCGDRFVPTLLKTALKRGTAHVKGMLVVP
jgi:hypothetical protein